MEEDRSCMKKQKEGIDDEDPVQSNDLISSINNSS
jgi:hypothetical protein